MDTRHGASGGYEMDADCENCGARVTVRIRSGCPAWRSFAACPTCGCAKFRYRKPGRPIGDPLDAERMYQIFRGEA